MKEFNVSYKALYLRLCIIDQMKVNTEPDIGTKQLIFTFNVIVMMTLLKDMAAHLAVSILYQL